METVSVKTRPSTTPPPYPMTKVSFMGLAVGLLLWSYVPRVLEFHLLRFGSRTHLGHVVRGSFGKEEHFQQRSHRKEEPVSSSKVTFCPPMVTLASH